MMKVPLVDLQAQYAEIRSEVEPAIHKVLERCDFILGEAVDSFENKFAAYCEVPFAVGVDSGVSALELVLRAWNLGPGDEVITVANSFIASASPVSFTGATPVLVDVDPETYLMTPELVAAAITPKTRVIIPVHLYGQPVDMDPIMELAESHGLRVLEDASQAHGARYKGRRVGSLGHAAAFSLYPGKNLGAYGDSGVVVTTDEELALKIKELRNYGQRQKYHHLDLAFNRRLDTLQAAVLEVKLAHLDRWNDARRRVARKYTELLGDSPAGLPKVAPNIEHVYHQFIVQVDDRDGVLARLHREGIGAGIHYPVPIHLQPAYKDLGYGVGSFSVTEGIAGRILSLPIYPEITEEQIEYVASNLKSIIGSEGADAANLLQLEATS